jgi:tetratricopeptide (TPR) repeat protein
MQRLGQLSSAARDLAGVCATVGRAFTLDVLRRMLTQDDEALAGALDELARRGIVREQSSPGAYDFSHDRIREAAYDALGAARRQLLHRRIAETLVVMRAGDLDRASAEIAAHFDHGGDGESALSYYRRAGEMALRLFANRHAITLFSRARELLEHSPPGPERDHTELALLTALGVALVAVEGWGTAGVIALYTRAAELGEKLEGRPSAPVLRAQALARLSRGDLAGSNDLGAQLLQQARRERDPALRVEAYYVKGVNSFWRGEFDLSRRQLQTALAGWDPRYAREHIALFAQDPGVVCGTRLGYALWFLGRADRARHEVDEAIALARRIEHPISLAYVLYFAAWLMNDCGDFNRVRVLVEELAVHTIEHDLGFFGPMIVVIRGWLRARAGEPRAALPEMGQALEKFRAAGNILNRTYAITLIARAHVLAGEIESGLIALNDEAAIAHETGQRFLDAELLRLRAEFLAQQFAAPELIRRSLRQACAIARRQGAIALELRAALSLARVEERAGQRAKGCAGLRPVFARFREGFETADLRDAAQFLNAKP